MSRLALSALAALLGCSEATPADESPDVGTGELDWSVPFGSAGDDFARGTDSGEDGDVYVAGYTNGSFEHGENAGSWDAFLTRHAESGELTWSMQWGGTAADFAQAVQVGPDGAIFVAGYSQGELDGLSSAGGHDAFLSRYEPSGERAWTRQWGTESDEYVYAAASTDEHVLVVGYTEGDLAATNAGEADAFVTCFDAAGEPAWSRQWGTSLTDYGQAVHADALGNVLVAGYTKDALGDDPNVGAEDAFLIKLDVSGELVWLRQWGSSTTDYGLSVTSDEAGNLYVTGYTYGAIADQQSAGGEDAFLSKLDADGVLLWTRQWGTAAADSARFVSVAPNGDLLVAGDTEGALEGHSSAGERDAFLVRFSPDGEQRSAFQWGSPAREFSLSVTAADRDVHVAGYSESASFEREALLTKWTF